MSRSFWTHLATWRHLWRATLGTLMLMGAAALCATILLLCPARTLPPPAQVHETAVVIGPTSTIQTQMTDRPALSGTATVALVTLADGRTGVLQVSADATIGSSAPYWRRLDSGAISATKFGPRWTKDKPGLALELALPTALLFIVGGWLLLTTLVRVRGEEVNEQRINARLGRLHAADRGHFVVPGLP